MSSATSQHELDELCRLAFEADCSFEFQEAFDKHTKAVAALTSLAYNKKFPDQDWKRLAKIQILLHSERRDVLRKIINGRKKGPDTSLPSPAAVQSCLSTPINGNPSLSRDEVLLSRALRSFYDEAQLAVIKENEKYKGFKLDLWNLSHVVNVKQVLLSYLISLKDKPRLMKPEIQHLLTKNVDGNFSVPSYTPALDKTKPDVVYHLSVFRDIVWRYLLSQKGKWYNFHVKDSQDSQTLYVFRAFVQSRHQAGTAELLRVTDMTSPCVKTLIQQVKDFQHFQDGRQLTHIMPEALPVVDKPRASHVSDSWEPRYFVWGGRQFVWRIGHDTRETLLCEIKGELSSSVQSECFEPIVRAPKYMFPTSEKGEITFRYGCETDVLFSELVLASFLTYQLVSGFVLPE
ncbi:hypothetical protein HJFPF1_07192 [Paramyrothecium foliicola]|nr:hypothetical protein HJFPF1_07192 [Paramyrothecium foliicola]